MDIKSSLNTSNYDTIIYIHIAHSYRLQILCGLTVGMYSLYESIDHVNIMIMISLPAAPREASWWKIWCWQWLCPPWKNKYQPVWKSMKNNRSNDQTNIWCSYNPAYINLLNIATSQSARSLWIITNLWSATMMNKAVPSRCMHINTSLACGISISSSLTSWVQSQSH